MYNFKAEGNKVKETSKHGPNDKINRIIMNIVKKIQQEETVIAFHIEENEKAQGTQNLKQLLRYYWKHQECTLNIQPSQLHKHPLGLLSAYLRPSVFGGILVH